MAEEEAGNDDRGHEAQEAESDGSALAEGEVPAFVNRYTSEVPLTGKGGTGGLLAMGFVVLGGFAGVWVWSRRRRDDEDHAFKRAK